MSRIEDSLVVQIAERRMCSLEAGKSQFVGVLYYNHEREKIELDVSECTPPDEVLAILKKFGINGLWAEQP